MKNIDIYATRIEIYPYDTPDKFDEIVKQCSTTFDRVCHRRYPLGCAYFELQRKLVVMRGVNMSLVSNYLESYPKFFPPVTAAKMKYKYKMMSPPRNPEQVKAIKFLSCYGEYAQLEKYSQQSLNAEPSFGKTYCTIAAAIERGVRTIIILHNSTVKTQWVTTLMELTTVRDGRIIDIQDSQTMREMWKQPVNADFILVLHQTLASYLRTEGYEKTKDWFDHLHCGLKVIDEAHLFFGSIVQNDFCTNIEKNFYLTGTMTRSNPIEVSLFKRYFSNTPAFKTGITLNVIYEFVEYNSFPDLQHQAYILTQRGPNASKFMEYATELDTNRTILKVMVDALNMAKTHEGRILIICPKIATCEIIKTTVEEVYPNDMVRTVHSRHSHDDNEESKESADIIISTISSLGTGSDIHGLRSIVILEPYTSEVTANQLPKRLRPLPNGDYSYCYDLVDIGFDALVAMERKRTRFLKKCCKEVKVRIYES